MAGPGAAEADWAARFARQQQRNAALGVTAEWLAAEYARLEALRRGWPGTGAAVAPALGGEVSSGDFDCHAAHRRRWHGLGDTG